MASLAQAFSEQAIELRYPNGARHSEFHAVLKAKISASVRHVLSPEATAMAAQVGLSKPSTVLKALRHAIPPFETTWIELDLRHMRAALGELGSPNIKMPGGIEFKRAGYIIERREYGFEMTAVTEQVDPRSGMSVIDAGLLTVRVDTRPEAVRPEAVRPEGADETPRTVHPAASGRVRDHLRAIARSPGESAAWDELAFRASGSGPAEGSAWLSMGIMMAIGTEAYRETNAKNRAEAGSRAISLIIPAIILLACKNAVQTVERPAEPKLDRARAKKGKPPILAMRDVVTRFTSLKPGAQGAERAALAASERASALVGGHFKTRRTGVWWWSEHARRGRGEPRRDRTIRP